jgi:hypothetical protein
MSVSVVTRIATPHPLPEARPVVKPVVVARPQPAPTPAPVLPLVDTLTISATAAPRSPVNLDSSVDSL